MPAPSSVTTIDELLSLPDDGMRHELLDGTHVVTPAPSYAHQVVLQRLFQVIARAVGGAKVQVLSSPADIRLNPCTLVQPDLFMVKDEDGSLNKSWSDVGVPLLAVEVLSARDRGIKRKLYLEAGVEEYWIVDIDARLIERWGQGDKRPEIHNEKMTWRLSIGIDGDVTVPDLFAGMQV